MRVLQLHERTDLLKEPAQKTGFFKNETFRYLDGDVLAKFGVLGQVDFGHSAFTNLVMNDISSTGQTRSHPVDLSGRVHFQDSQQFRNA